MNDPRDTVPWVGDPLTKEPGEYRRRDAVPGMAYFRGSGPSGKDCGACARYGEGGVAHGHGCAEYTRMTGQEVAIEPYHSACKYFETAKGPDGKPTKLW